MVSKEEPQSKSSAKEENLISILEHINISAFLDTWGPRNVMQVYNPELNMQGLLIIDNIALGPGCGGLHIAPVVTPRDLFNEARARTWINSLYDLTLGGAAAGIRGDPQNIDCSKFTKSFARKISPYVPDKVIMTPGIGVGQDEMRAFVEEVGDNHGATGKPEDIGGIPFELGVLGQGIGSTIEGCFGFASNFGIPDGISEAEVAIQGFDLDCCNNMQKLAMFLFNKGAKIVGLSDADCIIYNKNGLDVNKIVKVASMDEKFQLRGHKEGTVLPRSDLAKVKCDILVTSPFDRTIVDENLKRLKVDLIVEGGINTLTPNTEQVLIKKGTRIIPDLITMGGGSISSQAEINKDCRERAFSLIDKKVKETLKRTVEGSLDSGLPLRRVATEIAKQRILKAMEEFP